MDVEEDCSTEESEFDQVRRMTKTGEKRIRETVTKTAKREIIVWLVHTETRTQDDRNKTVALSKRTVGWEGLGGVRGGDSEWGDVSTGGQGGTEVTGSRDSSGGVLDTSFVNRSPIFSVRGDVGPED